MARESGHSEEVPPPDQPLWRRVLRRPGTRLGWWAVSLAAAFLALFAGIVFLGENVFVDARRQGIFLSYVFVMLISGLAAGIAGVVAVVRRQERSWMVWLAILTGMFVVAIVLGEILEYLLSPRL